MKDLKVALELALQAFHKEFGEEAKLKEGDEVVFELNNCVLIVEVKNGTLGLKFIEGKPLKVDHTLKIYESEEK